MGLGPTANVVNGQLVACSEGSCDTFEGGEWKHLVDTMDPTRILSSNAVNDHRMLLIGGLQADQDDPEITEWIPVDGSPAQPGPFNANANLHLHGEHCTIQTAPDLTVLSGGSKRSNAGDYTYEYVAHNVLSSSNEVEVGPILFFIKQTL